MLDLQMLQAMPPKTIFASGVIVNAPEGFYVAEEHIGEMLRWVAIRGRIHDWAIYYQWDTITNLETIATYGEKCHNNAITRKLVPCDEEAFNMYRH